MQPAGQPVPPPATSEYVLLLFPVAGEYMHLFNDQKEHERHWRVEQKPGRSYGGRPLEPQHESDRDLGFGILDLWRRGVPVDVDCRASGGVGARSCIAEGYDDGENKKEEPARGMSTGV